MNVNVKEREAVFEIKMTQNAFQQFSKSVNALLVSAAENGEDAMKVIEPIVTLKNLMAASLLDNAPEQ